MLSSEDEAIKLKALMYVTDRVYGKGKEQHEHTGKDGGPITVAGLDEIIARARARRAGQTT